MEFPPSLYTDVDHIKFINDKFIPKNDAWKKLLCIYWFEYTWNLWIFKSLWAAAALLVDASSVS